MEANIVVIKKSEDHASDAGYFEKNFLKLKTGQHLEYMLSRIILSFAGVTVGLYYLHDALYRHSKEGIPESVLFVVAAIFLMNGVRKMVRGFIKLREATWDGSVVEKPHNPGESWLMRVGFRFPLGQRRHLVSAMTLAAEGLGALLLVLSFVAICISEELIVFSWKFPFFLKAFAWSDITFPRNFWWGLVITGVARVLSYINNSIFLTKIPQVRQVLAETLKGFPKAEHLALYFPYQIFRLFRGIGNGDGRQPCNEHDALEMADRILNEYPEEVISHAHKIELREELAAVICREHDPLVLIAFLKDRVAAFKMKK